MYYIICSFKLVICGTIIDKMSSESMFMPSSSLQRSEVGLIVISLFTIFQLFGVHAAVREEFIRARTGPHLLSTSIQSMVGYTFKTNMNIGSNSFKLLY
jgi:hypothetical protein